MTTSEHHPPGEVVDALVQSAFSTMAVLSTVAAGSDLSLTQMRVLAILRDRRVRMGDLALYLGLDRSTMTGLVDRAEKRGLLTRAANPVDGRAVDVHLTAAGATLADRLARQVARELAPATDRLSRSEQGRLGELLVRVIGPDPLPT